MDSYYTDKLAAKHLQRCYRIAPPRVQQYLEAEVQHVLKKIRRDDLVLELGCGYGRVLEKLAEKARVAVGIDTSRTSLELGKRLLRELTNCHFFQMNAVQLAFPDDLFDATTCIQNGISAFGVNQLDLIREAVRVTKPGGVALFSSYSDRFWSDRLEWFQLQAREGLLGEIDIGATGDGVIVCKDGFRATTVRRDDFVALTSKLDLKQKLIEVDESSLFCEIYI